MAILGPITSERRRRQFAVIDLEWVPGEELPLPESAQLDIVGISDPLDLPLPGDRRMTKPLSHRLSGYYGEVEAEDDAGEVERAEEYHCFRSVRDLLDHILVRSKRGWWFFAHAGGLADMEFVLDEIFTEMKASLPNEPGRTKIVVRGDGTKIEEHRRGGIKVRASFSGSSAIIVHVTRGKNSWHFVDSYWLLRDKLSKIGEQINIKKGDTPEAVAYLKQRFGRESLDLLSQVELKEFFAKAPIEILTSYNRIDCKILYKAIKEFEKEIWELGGQLQQTIASTGMMLFRRAYLKREIVTSERVNKIAEQSYFASRVEVISRNASDFFMYDVNSSFPYSMTFPQPGGLAGISGTLPDDDSEECIYLADVTIEVPEDIALPPIPVRMGGRVFFPVGRWRSWLTSTDVKLALREGCIVHKVHEVYLFEPFYDIKGYSEDIYGRRAASTTDFRKLVLKYLLNSLYGKFAESPWKQEMLMDPDDVDRENMQMLQPGVWLRDKEVPIVHRHVPISTHITALSRRLLYDYDKLARAQGHPSKYFDSISGDRTVVLKAPNGSVVIDPIEEVWAERGRRFRQHRGRKEVCVLGHGWKALARDSHGNEGWFPFRRLIRHKTSKEMYLISSKRGQVNVTEDHSLMVGEAEIKPRDFVARKCGFDVLAAQPGMRIESIDLLDHVRGFERKVVRKWWSRKRGKWTIKTISHHFVGSCDWVRYFNFRGLSRGKFKRRFRRGSADFHSLLRLLAAYISEGSASLRGVTATRDCFSISQQEKRWLDRIKEDLSSLIVGIKLLGSKWSEGSGTYYLRSGAGLLPCLFSELAGMKSRNKKLPSFVYDLSDDDFLVFWEKLVEGDGCVDVAGRQTYTTSSQRLAAGLSYALDQHGMEHSIHYRPDKKSYLIRLRPKDSERMRSATKVEKSFSSGYVYDLEVCGAHTFVDGLGRVLLHNTDCINTRAVLPTDEKKLGALKLEKKLAWAEFVAPKIYRGEGFKLKKDGTWTEAPEPVAKAKGFSLDRIRMVNVDDGESAKTVEERRAMSARAAFEKLGRIIGGERAGVQRMTRIRELYRSETGQGEGGRLHSPVEIMVVKALTFEMLSKRCHYPDGETRPWHISELMSGEIYPRGFDFEPEILARLDTTTRAMMAAAM